MGSIQRLEGTDKYRICPIFFVGYHIKQVVNTVTKIDIADAAGPVHGFGACGTEPLIGMGSFVSASAISFGFGDDTAGQGLLVYPGAEYHSQEALGRSEEHTSELQ